VIAANKESLNLANALHAAQQQQRPMTPLYANLSQLLQLQHKQYFDALPALVRERIQVLWRALLDNQQIQKAAGLKQTMSYSGPFTATKTLLMPAVISALTG